MKNNSSNLKAVLYARKSTESEDKQVQSIDDQIRIMQQIAKDDGVDIIKILKESKSAKAPNARPVFEEMKRGIENKEFNCIFVWDTSRLSRNPVDGGALQWMLDQGDLKGIRTHEKWYHESDDLLFTIENSMNSRFIKELRSKVSRGMESKAQKGGCTHVAPVGYLNNRADKTIEKDPVTFDRVERLWKYALTGIYTIAELTRIADTELGIRTHQTKRQGGKPLSQTGMKRLLTNPFYAGMIRYKGQIYNGNHPSMISFSDFEKAQAIFSSNKHSTRPKDTTYNFILRGLLTCSECGHSIVTEKKFKKLKDGTVKEYHYCHCCDKKKTCKYRSINIREEELLDQIRDELAKYTIDDDLYRVAIDVLVEEDSIEVSKQNDRIASINKQLAQAKADLDNLRRAIYTGKIIDNGFFLSEQKLLEDKIKHLENDRSQVMSASKDWREIANDTFMFARYAKEDFESDDWERKRAVIRRLGANLKLSGRTIEFTPVKYLIPIENYQSSLTSKKEPARTASQQIEKGPDGAKINTWYTQ